MSDTGRFGDAGLLAGDTPVGDDGDAPGIAQPVSQAEIDDLLNDATMPIEERRARLEAIAAQLGERGAIDRGGDFEPMQGQLDEALSMLAEGGHTYGVPEAVGLDPESRSDARSPDDDRELL